MIQIVLLSSCRSSEYGLGRRPDSVDVPGTGTHTGAAAPSTECGLSVPDGNALGAAPTCEAWGPPNMDIELEFEALLTDRDTIPFTVAPMVHPSPARTWIATTSMHDPVLLDGVTGSTLARAESSIQAENPTCGGAIGGHRWIAEWSLEADGTRLISRTLDTLVEHERGIVTMTHDWSCSIADLNSDGSFEVASVLGSWSFPEVEVLGQFEPPNPLADGEWRETYGCFARPYDLMGDCRLLRPQADGLLDPYEGVVAVPWSMGSEPLMRGFTGGVTVVAGEPVIWGVDGAPSIGDPDRDRILQLDVDGALRWALPFFGVDTPSIADVDGDEEPEMCVSGADGVLWMIEGDGSLKWSLPSRGPSPIPEDYGDAKWAFPQCVLSDLDADGAYEAVVFDQRGLRVLEGSSGQELASNRAYVLPGGRWWQSPTVADVDGDGSAEIVTMAYRSDATDPVPDLYLVSFGAAEGRWARTRPVWNEYAYDVTSIGSDGELVSWPVPSWEAYNTFRAQPSFDGAHPDLVPVFVDLCVTDGACDMNPTGEVLVSVQIENRGSTDQPEGAVVRLFTKPEDGCFTVAAEQVLEEGIAAGWSSDAVVLTAAAEDWGVRQVVEVWYDVPKLDPDRDCDLVNNRLALEEEACP